jgi:hypothetical protein
MNTNTLKFAALALLLAGSSITGCKSSDEGKGATEVTRSQGRANETTTYTRTARVTGIDMANRRVTLTTPEGTQKTYTAGPAVRNFDKIRIGDQVKTTLTEETALSLGRGEAPSSTEGTSVMRAPEGSQPGAVIANTRQKTAKIVAINGRDVTLQFADGTTRSVKVGKDVNLTGLGPGDTVTGRFTEATAIAVEKP